jgi:hypothetical protein
MEIPAPDASKLLQLWMEWERGDVTPGRVMSNLKTAGMRQLLEDLAQPGGSAPKGPDDATAGVVAAGLGAGRAELTDNAPTGPNGPAGGPPPPWAPVV